MKIFLLVLSLLVISLSNAYADPCRSVGPSHLSQSATDICRVTMATPLCLEVPDHEKLDCRDLNSNIVSTSFDFLKGCASGAFNSIKDTLSFLWEIMKWAWSNVTSSSARTSSAQVAGSMMSSAKLYLHTEYQKAYDKTSIPLRTLKAVKKMGGAVASLFINTISEYIAKEYEQFDCLNQTAKSAMICKAASDIFIPPAGAIALIKYGPNAIKQFPNLKKLFSPKSPRDTSFELTTKKFSSLAVVNRNIASEIPVTKKINNPSEIPFAASGTFRPASTEQMLLRAKELPPDISRAITSAYNALNDRESLSLYFRDLHKDAVNFLAKKENPNIDEMLEKGRVSKHSIGVVVIQRLKARGDNRFTTINGSFENNISTGRIRVDPADIETNNRAFRTAVRTGPFIDRNFKDTSAGGHGVFTHVIQRDIVTKAVAKELGGDAQKFWDFLGTPKGVNWWADLFDSGTSQSITSPEVLSSFLERGLNTQ